MKRIAPLPNARCLALFCWLVAGTGTIPAHADSPRTAKLVIVSAVYGDLANEKTVDVLKKIAERVKENNLSFEVTADLFGDPAPGAPKKLKVGYTIDGIYRSKTVEVGEVLDISTRLFISKAVYGDLPRGKFDDVTEQVAALVRKNKLSVKADNETFGDPAENVVKKLRVDYVFDGVKKSRTVTEGETLTVSEEGR